VFRATNSMNLLPPRHRHFTPTRLPPTTLPLAAIQLQLIVLACSPRDTRPSANFSEESNAPRVRSLAPTKARRQERVVADIAKLSVGREEYYTRALATDHEQYLSGHGESPGRWYGAAASGLGLHGEASVAGFQAMFEGRHPDTGELLGRPTARGPCRRSTWFCGRPRACRSCTAWGMRRPAGRCSRRIMLGWPRRSPTWTSTSAHGVDTAVSSTCPNRAAGGRL